MKLRLAVAKDLHFILNQETREEFQDLIARWSPDEHLSNIKNPDKGYFMVESNQSEVLGYIILSDLKSVHRCIFLQRIVIAQPGKGQGKIALKLMMEKVFQDYKAHRFWLDVFEYNHRAISVYKSLGFKEEGKLREAFKREDKYHSILIMSILDREYFQSSKMN
ncbi:MAG: GNAT family protein [Microcoleaceae cyanobacterium]